ncbi:MAG: proton-conducting transporter membrane subunit [Candidatus Dormibacteria bacterium]
MNWAFLQDFGPVGLLVLGGAVCAGLDLLPAAARDRGPRSRWVALLALLLAFLASIGFWHSSFGPAPPEIEHGGLVIDRFALFFDGLALAAAAAAILCGADREGELDPHRGVFHLLVLVASAGVLFTAAAADVVSLVAGLALTTLPLGLALGLRKTSPAAQRQATRSLAVNGFALACFGAGAAVLAGLGGSTALRAIPHGLTHVDPLLVLGALLLLLGAGAQLGTAPYLLTRAQDAARLPLAAVLAASLLGPLAAVAALLRLLPGALGAAPASWGLLVQLLAALSLLTASWLALRQRRLGRAVILLLAAQLALVLGAFPQGSSSATASVLYFMLGWVPLAAAWLGLLAVLGMGEGRDTETGLRGLFGRSPMLASGLVVLLAALAGLPPLAGFFGRWLTVAAALESGTGWLVGLELVSWLLGVLVAWRWLVVIFDARLEGEELELPGRTVMVGIGLCGAAALTFGLLLGPLFAIASRGALSPLVGP